ncbi:MAG: hypothetical protein M3N29_09910 [Chloroflexota bacterium]|nr:hypothetical protein [Chloroflexota bacterium]
MTWRLVSLEEAIAKLVAEGMTDAEVFAFLEGDRRRWWGDERKRVAGIIRQARAAGGPPPGQGLTPERLEEQIAKNWPPGRAAPTQTALRHATGYSERTISEVARQAGGWRAMIKRVATNRR